MLNTKKVLLAFFYINSFLIISYAQEQKQHIYSIANLSFEVEMHRLDEVAPDLISNPEKIVYLVAYNKSGRKKATAITRLKKSQNYLVKKHKISLDRIITIYGGNKDEGIIMNIFVVDKSEKQ
jgi:hypothetical protein